MNWITKLAHIDRRWIFLVIALAVIIPLLIKPKMPIPVSPPVESVYDFVDSLPAGSVVMFSIDYDAASMPEMQPLYEAMLQHCFEKNLRPLIIVQWQMGAPLATLGVEKVAKEFGKEYGVDYVNLGYRPGYSAQMVGIGKELRDYFKEDYKATPIDSLPMMKELAQDGAINYEDIALLVGLEAGSTGNLWVEYAGARFGQKIALGLTAVSAPDAYPFLQSGQIIGLMGGLKGAAEYEYLVDRVGLATAGMAAQSYAHLLIIIFIIMGNIAYFIEKKSGKDKGV